MKVSIKRSRNAVRNQPAMPGLSRLKKRQRHCPRNTRATAVARRLVSGASVLVAVAHANLDSAVMADAGRRQRDLPGHRLCDRNAGWTLGASSVRVDGPLNRE